MAAIDALHGLAGAIEGAASDRNKNRAAHLQAIARATCGLCVEILSRDPPGPYVARSGWVADAVRGVERQLAAIEADRRGRADDEDVTRLTDG